MDAVIVQHCIVVAVEKPFGADSRDDHLQEEYQKTIGELDNHCNVVVLMDGSILWYCFKHAARGLVVWKVWQVGGSGSYMLPYSVELLVVAHCCHHESECNAKGEQVEG